jgi:hypothetical protein
MANNYAQIWSAVAASFSALAALTIMYINRKNMIDSASPEIVIDGWNREIKRIGESEYDTLTFSNILNTGKGSALHVFINATNIINKFPLTSCSSERFAIIPSRKDVNVSGEITLWWKNVSDSHRLLPIKITIYSWSTKGYRYTTVYQLVATELNNNFILAGGGLVANGIMLTTRYTKCDHVLKLKAMARMARLPVIGRFFKINQ